MRAWTDEEKFKLIELSQKKDDLEAKAISCYGMLRADKQEILLRFVNGRPVSSVTIEYLEWIIDELGNEGKKALLLIWDNASWHKSLIVRSWIKTHNRKVKLQGGVRILVCRLPIKSPWLNPIEPRWVHAKRAIVEPTRVLSIDELIYRICLYFGSKRLPLINQKVG
jgi:transposase